MLLKILKGRPLIYPEDIVDMIEGEKYQSWIILSDKRYGKDKKFYPLGANWSHIDHQAVYDWETRDAYIVWPKQGSIIKTGSGYSGSMRNSDQTTILSQVEGDYTFDDVIGLFLKRGYKKFDSLKDLELKQSADIIMDQYA